MSSRLQKHSLTLQGHRTSVTLEDEFWAAFGQIARARVVSVNHLAAEIDASRRPGEGLASAIRVFCLNWYQTGQAKALASATKGDASS